MIKTSCRHYRGNIPCRPNKLRGKECPTCDEFNPFDLRILIIKLGAAGDVLRTTALLPGILHKWPGCEITWLTRRESALLLENLPAIDRILILEEEGALQILGESFDVCINLDNDPLSASLASRERAVLHLGYILDENGKVVAANEDGDLWLSMSVFDRRKKENTETCQSHMRRIVGIPADQRDPIQIRLHLEEIEAACCQLKSIGANEKPFIAFNTGAGERWQTKKWKMERFLELGFLLKPHTPGKILLLGGPSEEERNRILAMERPDLFTVAPSIPLRHFMALVGECSLLISADTLALHIGIGLGVPTVGIFGPTSSVEIESLSPFIRMKSDMECGSFYARECDKKPCCMEEISARMVYDAIENHGWLENLLETGPARNRLEN